LYTHFSISTLAIKNIDPPVADDRDAHRNVGIQRTPNAADSPRRLYPDVSFTCVVMKFTSARVKSKELNVLIFR
jgi:hypothetical protein